MSGHRKFSELTEKLDRLRRAESLSHSELAEEASAGSGQGLARRVRPLAVGLVMTLGVIVVLAVFLLRRSPDSGGPADEGSPPAAMTVPPATSSAERSTTTMPTPIDDDPQFRLAIDDGLWKLADGQLTKDRSLGVIPWAVQGVGLFQSVLPDSAGGFFVIGVPTTGARPDLPNLYSVRSSGEPTEIAPEVTSMAVSASGRLATVETAARGAAQVIKVRDRDSKEPVEWSDSTDTFVLVGWAGDRLVAIRSYGDSAPTDLFVFDGPFRGRQLAPAAGPNAISPDGRSILYSRLEGAEGERTVAAVLDLDTGVELPLPLLDGQFLGVAEWIGDTIVSNDVAATGGVGFVEFHVGDDVITRVRDVPIPADVAGSLYDTFVLADGTLGSYGTTPTDRSALVLCGVETGCSSKRIETRGQVNRVRNPSGPRPSPGAVADQPPTTS